MMDPYKKHTSYTAGFFMLIAFCVAGFILASILGIGFLMGKTGQQVIEIKELLSNPAYLREMQIFQTITAVMGFLVPTIATAAFLSQKPLMLIGFKEGVKSQQLSLTILIILCGLGISSGLGYLTYQLPIPQNIKVLFNQWEADYAAQAAALVKLNSIPELFISILVLALVPAICEEAFFRGGLQNFLYRGNHKMWFSVIVVSIIFSIVHFSGYGFLSRMALGLILGLIYHFTGNIWLNITAHFINNALAVLMMYTQVQSGKPVTEVMNDKTGSYLGLLAIPVVILLFQQLKKRTTKNPEPDGA